MRQKIYIKRLHIKVKICFILNFILNLQWCKPSRVISNYIYMLSIITQSPYKYIILSYLGHTHLRVLNHFINLEKFCQENNKYRKNEYDSIIRYRKRILLSGKFFK